MDKNKLPFLSQSNFPRLWLIFQNMIGGNFDKMKVYSDAVGMPQTILEVGCSVGNATPAFSSHESLRQYVGVDIDNHAIQLAKKRYSGVQHVSFLAADIHQLSSDDMWKEYFDIIVVPGMAHHQPDDVLIPVLSSCRTLLKEEGRIWLIDPLKPGKEDGWLINFYLTYLEQGKFLRTLEDLIALGKESECRIVQAYTRKVGATPWSFPHCSNFGVLELSKE